MDLASLIPLTPAVILSSSVPAASVGPLAVAPPARLPADAEAPDWLAVLLSTLATGLDPVVITPPAPLAAPAPAPPESLRSRESPRAEQPVAPETSRRSGAQNCLSEQSCGGWMSLMTEPPAAVVTILPGPVPAAAVPPPVEPAASGAPHDAPPRPAYEVPEVRIAQGVQQPPMRPEPSLPAFSVEAQIREGASAEASHVPETMRDAPPPPHERQALTPQPERRSSPRSPERSEAARHASVTWDRPAPAAFAGRQFERAKQDPPRTREPERQQDPRPAGTPIPAAHPASPSEKRPAFAARPAEPTVRPAEPAAPSARPAAAPPPHAAVESPPPALEAHPAAVERTPAVPSRPPELHGAERMIEQAAVRASSNANEVQLWLRPERLGRVAVRLVERGGVVDVAVRTERPSAQALLSESLPSLVEGLSERGWELSRVTRGQAENGPEWSAQDGKNRGGHGGQPGSRDHRRHGHGRNETFSLDS